MLSNLENIRIEKGYSINELAEHLEITSRQYYNWINEKSDIPGRKLLKLSKLLDVDMEELLESEEGRNEFIRKKKISSNYEC